MCQWRPLADWRSEPSTEKRQRARRGTAQDVNRGQNEQLKGHHGRDRIAGQAEDKFVAAGTEDGRTARTNRHGVEEELGAQLSQHHLNQVIFPH